MTYNFQSRFARLVQSRKKRSTIRADRKDGKVPRLGETLHFFTGMRTKRCRRLGKVACLAVTRITLHSHGFELNGKTMPAYMTTVLAQRDGFKDFEQMLAWFKKTHGLPFTGNLIEW